MYMHVLVRNNAWCTFWYGTTHGPAHGPARQIHGPAHVIVGPAHVIVGPARVEPVFHVPRCTVMSRAGPGFFFNVMGRAGPGPIL